ncbi:MAG: biopolymer transporter ExbD [Treponema sp.]|jgi:biopolymer transport protein ExbD|nr:biopolymer transporter ExbD [Treponema sp.]
MKIKHLKKTSFQDSSAASDVAFLLIIYFMVIAGFNINRGFLLNLPAKDSTRIILGEDLIRFEMDREGRILHDKEIINIQTAKNIIHSGKISNPNIAVIITIDGQAHWQNVVYFVELAQDMEIDSFSFTMKKDVQ